MVRRAALNPLTDPYLLSRLGLGICWLSLSSFCFFCESRNSGLCAGRLPTVLGDPGSWLALRRVLPCHCRCGSSRPTWLGPDGAVQLSFCGQWSVTGSTPTPFPHRWAPSGTRAGTGEMVQGSKSLMCFCGSLGHTRRRACPPETRSPLGVLPPPPALWGPFPLSSDSLSPLGFTVSAATKCRDGPPRGSKWESKEENQPPTLPRFRS